MTVPFQPCTNQTRFSWPPQATWCYSEGKRQTDWLHGLSLGHYTALSDPVCPLIFLLAFFYTPFLMERPSTFIAFLVNNTSGLSKEEKWQNGWQVRWRGGKKPVWNEENKLPKLVWMCCGGRKNEWTGRKQKTGGMSTGEWRGHVVESKGKRGRTGGQSTLSLLNASRNMRCGWLGGCCLRALIINLFLCWATYHCSKNCHLWSGTACVCE